MTAPINILPLFQVTIPKRQSQCKHCHGAFSSAMTYYSLLEPLEAGITRHDYCLPCWELKEKEAVKTGKTHWKSKVTGKSSSENKSDKTHEAHALNLLRQAAGEKGGEEQAEAFVLALYLARKRYLYLRQQIAQDDGSVIHLYEVAATEEMIPVKRVTLSKLHLEGIQKGIAAKLYGENQ